MNATNINCSSPAKPAALEATARNAATGTGAPSYVSGAQNWNGNAETLNAKPTTTNRIAASAIGSWEGSSWPSAVAISSSRVFPPVSP